MTERGELMAQVQMALRTMGAGLGRLNEAAGAVVDLNGVDIEVLDHLGRVGPISPGELAATLNIHPATMTGIVDRLEAGGWLVRERDDADRRRVLLSALRQRAPELARIYAPMNRAVGDLCRDLTVEQLETVRDFLTAISGAADDNVDRLLSKET